VVGATDCADAASGMKRNATNRKVPARMSIQAP
jgi:hypothetical protein